MTPPVASAPQLTSSLSDALTAALAAAPSDDSAALDSLYGADPTDRRDRALTLLSIYDLSTAPLDVLGDTVRLQGSPAIADLKSRLEGPWVLELEQAWADAPPLPDATTPDGAVAAMRAVAVKDRLPTAYRWLATDAELDDLVAFLALEGGPDGGFDDLVAACQIGLTGSPKMEMAQNYWDEMGNGDPAEVHTTLHERLAAAIGLVEVPREQLPLEALERAALAGLFATNRWLQPEMIGALGLLELQAGPRCRLVLQALDRLGAPADAYPFYEVHADVDPRHGADWVDKVIVPTVRERPEWGPRILRGAWWRSTTNLAFFEAARRRLVEQRSAA